MVCKLLCMGAYKKAIILAVWSKRNKKNTQYIPHISEISEFGHFFIFYRELNRKFYIFFLTL